MPVENVSVDTKSVIVTVASSGEKIVVPSKRVRIVTVGKVGPSGANAGAWTTQVFQLEESQQEFTLDFMPRAGSAFVYLNGLLERFWDITGTTITLEDPALSGDTIAISYQKET